MSIADTKRKARRPPKKRQTFYQKHKTVIDLLRKLKKENPDKMSSEIRETARHILIEEYGFHPQIAFKEVYNCFDKVFK